MSDSEKNVLPKKDYIADIYIQIKSKRFWFVILSLFLILFVVRFALVKDDHVHYHANFGVFINGQQEKFDSPLYYEEVQTCSLHDDDDPKRRTHMHNNESGLVHVHAPAVTWGHFFTNIGITVSKNLIQTPNGIFQDSEDGNELSFFLNNEKIDSITNKIIGNEDVLLVTYGKPSSNEDVVQQFAKIPRTAKEANTKQDPATCSGSVLTTRDRIIKALQIWQ